jgi:hypothetical protein
MTHECSQTFFIYRNTVTTRRNLDNMTSYDSRQYLIMLLSKDLDSVFLVLYTIIREAKLKTLRPITLLSDSLPIATLREQLEPCQYLTGMQHFYYWWYLFIARPPAMCSREWCDYCPPGYHHHIIQFFVFQQRRSIQRLRSSSSTNTFLRKHTDLDGLTAFCRRLLHRRILRLWSIGLQVELCTHAQNSEELLL